jgi:hypothetical protein
MNIHAHILKHFAPAQLREVHKKRARDDLAPQPFDQFDASASGAASCQQVIDD